MASNRFLFPEQNNTVVNSLSDSGQRDLVVDLGERSYPIYFGFGLLFDIGQRLKQREYPLDSPILLISDKNVAKLYGNLVQRSLALEGYKVTLATIPPGEKSKSLAFMEKLIAIALKSGLDRHSTVIALGGGVVGDIAGFLAAIYMRGIRFIQLPTTILAHDSSIGGKVAVNHGLTKNLIGAFHQPDFVLYDLDTISTLSIREIRSGFAEVIKQGLIWSADFVAWCGENSAKLLSLEKNALSYAIYESCRIKAIIVSRDEREANLRAILNLGHTIGHALETVAGYGTMTHGEAIAIGMVGAARLATLYGYDKGIVNEIELLLQKFGLPIRIPQQYTVDQIYTAMLHDKKFVQGRMVFVIPNDIGTVEVRHDVQAHWVKETIGGLRLD